MTTVLNIKKNNHASGLAFLDPQGSLGMQRYETLKYKQFEKLTERQLSFFWQPQEIDLSGDGKDFKDLEDHEKHIFTSNLKRQILLDSVQGRSPNLAFLPIVTIPELETWIETWAFSETIHSKSYTHIIRNIYPDPSKVFDEMADIKEIIECGNDISRYYDELITALQWYQLLGEGTHTVNGNTVVVSKYELKKLLWLCLNSVNVLEGIRFYVSFACSWAFAEVKRMEGNAKIIKLICRDENLHLASTQTMLKLLPKDDPDFETIKNETREACTKMFTDAVAQEEAWAKYLFKDGSIVGLTESLLTEYVEWTAHKRMLSLGLTSPFKGGSNPLPWTQKWIEGSDVQVAPQETEITSYTIGAVKQDVNEDTFKGFSL